MFRQLERTPAPAGANVRQIAVAGESKIEVSEQKDRVDVSIDGTLVTSYHFSDDLLRPMVHPLQTPAGIVVTRGYPLDKSETTDHPTQVGIFFAADGVNDSNFWSATANDYHIEHVAVSKAEGGERRGVLSTTANWIGNDGTTLLEETRDMRISADRDANTIDFTNSLTAAEKKVVFADPKEALFGIRLADWMRVESEQTPPLLGAAQKGGGKYLNSNGAKVEKEVWGNRAKWLRVEAKTGDDSAGVVIFDHPSNVNHPTYWHARGYGLLAANPLGQEVFEKTRYSKNVKPLNLTLNPGKSVTFHYRVLIYDGMKTKRQLDREFDEFAKSSN